MAIVLNQGIQEEIKLKIEAENFRKILFLTSSDLKLLKFNCNTVPLHMSYMSSYFHCF